MRTILMLFGLLISHFLLAQNSNFKAGIYLSISDFKANKPSIAFEQLTNKDGQRISDIDIYRKNYYRQNDSLIKLNVDAIFGYADKGIFYVKTIYQGSAYFGRLVVIGSICHYVCLVSNNYYDPNFNQTMRTTNTLQQFILDTETGIISVFNSQNFEELLKRDEALYNAFISLPKKKKRNSQFLYLRKYNEAHPLLIEGIK